MEGEGQAQRCSRLFAHAVADERELGVDDGVRGCSSIPLPAVADERELDVDGAPAHKIGRAHV